MRLPWQRGDLARTCEECGYTWRVPRSAARRRIKTISTFGATPTGTNRAELARQVSAIAARNQVYETYDCCPECGAERRFIQRPARDDQPR